MFCPQNYRNEATGCRRGLTVLRFYKYNIVCNLKVKLRHAITADIIVVIFHSKVSACPSHSITKIRHQSFTVQVRKFF